MTEPCGAQHPERSHVTCEKPAGRCFAQHNAYDAQDGAVGAPVFWPNPLMPPTGKAKGIPPRPATVTPTTAGTPEQAWQEFVQRPTRPDDPVTSHAAAGTTLIELRESQSEVLGLFQDVGPMSDTDLVATAQRLEVKQSVSGLRTRRSELVTMGLLRDSGRRGKTENDRDTIIWETTSPSGATG